MRRGSGVLADAEDRHDAGRVEAESWTVRCSLLESYMSRGAQGGFLGRGTVSL